MPANLVQAFRGSAGYSLIAVGLAVGLVLGSGPAPFAAGAAGTLSSTPRNAYSHAAGTESNQLVWNPTLTVAVPDTAVATTYRGTVTHLVA